jgi:hypothetical protein
MYTTYSVLYPNGIVMSTCQRWHRIGDRNRLAVVLPYLSQVGMGGLAEIVLTATPRFFTVASQ